MKFNCDRCNSKFRSSIKELIKTCSVYNHRLCKECIELYDYEHSGFDFPGEPSYYDCYHCGVRQYTSMLYKWFEKQIGKRCAIQLRNGDYFIASIDGFDKGRIYLTAPNRPKCILVPHIAAVEVIQSSDGERKFCDSSGEICGYKGIRVRNGILDADGYIYEFGIPYQEEMRDPFKTDFQDVYSHFCMSIEDVLIHWRDCITQVLQNAENGTHYGEYRLFRVKAKGHCFPNTSTGWVSNDLTIISEVTQSEIIKYFTDHPGIREKVMQTLEKDCGISDLWERYQKVTIKPYSNILDTQEIIKLCTTDCTNYLSESCAIHQDYTKCFSCEFYRYGIDASLAYLATRKKIQDGTFDFECADYKALKAVSNKPMLASIQRLIEWQF